MKNKRNLGLAAMGLAGIVGGIVYFNHLAEKPQYGSFGCKESFPEAFNGRKLKPDELHPLLKEAYFKGYASDETIIGVLDGRIANIEPRTPQTR